MYIILCIPLRAVFPFCVCVLQCVCDNTLPMRLSSEVVSYPLIEVFKYKQVGYLVKMWQREIF